MKLAALRIIYIALTIITLSVTYYVITKSPLAELLIEPGLLLDKIRSLGVLGPLLVVGLMALAIVFNPLPSAPVALAAWKISGVSTGDAQDLVAYIKSLWSRRELDCQGPKHMQCMQ